MPTPSFSTIVAVLEGILVASSSARAQDHEVSWGRLVFSDHERPVVRVLDLDTGKVTHTFRVPKARASLSTTDGGRFVGVLTGDKKDTVRILDNRLVFEARGDHRDVEKRVVRMLKITLTGDRPTHVVSGHGRTAVFFDGPRPSDRQGGAKAVLLDHARLARDGTIVPSWTSPHPQRGMAVPLDEDLWAVSQPSRVELPPSCSSGSQRHAIGLLIAEGMFEAECMFERNLAGKYAISALQDWLGSP